MKTRILSLTLALILLVSALTLPASAATGKEVHTYLKNYAMDGVYDSDEHCFYNGFRISNEAVFVILYMEQDAYIQATLATSSFEVTWRISSNPSPAYNAYIEVYDDQGTKGVVVLAADYDGSQQYTGFKTFTGNTSSEMKSAMLQAFNQLLPAVIEFTRLVINENDYTLRDLGMTGYRACNFAHAYDKGSVTTQPTCVSVGVKTYTCRVCGDTDTENIPATGQHSWNQGEVAVPAGCTTDGTKRYTCTVCSATRDEAIPALGHTWSFTELLTAGETLHESTGIYTCTRCKGTKEAALCAKEVFTDMPKKSNWAHNPIDWAYFNSITAGKTPTTFAPNDTVTRAEAMTFLWTTVHRPETTLTSSPFKDVKAKHWFYTPVLWAYENEVTGGMTPTKFGPNERCTRAQIVTFLWAAMGKPEPNTEDNPFKDVKAKHWFYKAVLWAYENQITGGLSENTFGPNESCTRAQVVGFLFKAESLLNTEDPLPEET